MQTITLRLKLHRPTLAKQRLYREMTERTTALANNLVAAGRPKRLTSKTAAPYLVAPIPSAVVNQALRDVTVAKRVERFRVLSPSFNNQNLRIEKAGDFWTVSFPTHAGRVRVPVAATPKQCEYLSRLGESVKQGAPSCTRSGTAGISPYPSPSKPCRARAIGWRVSIWVYAISQL